SSGPKSSHKVCVIVAFGTFLRLSGRKTASSVAPVNQVRTFLMISLQELARSERPPHGVLGACVNSRGHRGEASQGRPDISDGMAGGEPSPPVAGEAAAGRVEPFGPGAATGGVPHRGSVLGERYTAADGGRVRQDREAHGHHRDAVD